MIDYGLLVAAVFVAFLGCLAYFGMRPQSKNRDQNNK